MLNFFMSTATLTAILCDPALSSRAEVGARKLASEATAEARVVIEAMNAKIESSDEELKLVADEPVS